MVDREAWVFGPTLAQVLTERIDQTGTVLWDAEHPLGPVGSGVTFDGVQGQLQASGTFEQTHTLLEQAMHLMPAFQRRLGSRPVIDGGVQHGGPAGAVCFDLAQDGFTQVVP